MPLVNGRRGHEYGKPVATMRAYLEEMAAAKVDLVASEQNVVLAALGPKMLKLSRDLTQGALPSPIEGKRPNQMHARETQRGATDDQPRCGCQQFHGKGYA